MPDITLQNASGEAAGTVALDDAIFGAPVRGDLVHAAVVAQLAAKRAGTHKAKTRGEVRGGGRKPYRQKGTGRARQGSTRAPQWKGGGVIFPPTPRDYSQRLPRKVRRAALFSAWSDHVAGGTLVVADSLAPEAPRTKLAAAALRALITPAADRFAGELTPPADRPEGDDRPVRRLRHRRRVLVLLEPAEDDWRRAYANLCDLRFDYQDKITVTFGVRVQTAPYASVYDLTLADVVVASRAAIERVTAEFSGDKEDVA